MRPLGPLVRLQVQRSSLKTGERPLRTYDPAPLLAVGRLALSPDGALGSTPDGGWIVDVHHRGHPDTKNPDGLHGVSVGFTAHYGAMRERFGERLTMGCAGENLIAATGSVLHFDDVAGGLAVLAPDGTERVRLKVLEVAQPCRPFTGWALGGAVEAAVLKENLQFLEGGMRGFYCTAEGSGTIAVGDLLVAL
ncbi:MAG TPA: MOSC domain-containing protein [Gemmatimonadales bacterium]|nr:MOSC domain-containing protein [Gemmatimonadales bacterium]